MKTESKVSSVKMIYANPRKHQKKGRMGINSQNTIYETHGGEREKCGVSILYPVEKKRGRGSLGGEKHKRDNCEERNNSLCMRKRKGTKER